MQVREVNKRVNILILAPVPNIKDGITHPAPWISTFINHLSKESRFNITVLNYSHKLQRKIEIYDYNNIKFCFIKTIHPKIDLFLFYRNRIRTLRKYIRNIENEIHIVHIFGNEHLFEISSSFLKGKILLHIQGVISEYRKVTPGKGFKYLSWFIISIFEKQGYNNVDKYSCRTHWDENIVLRNRPDAEIYHIWEMIRPEFFKYDRHLDPFTNNILFLGGTNELKGIDIALKSIALLKKMGKSFKLLIGGNANKKVITKTVKRNNLEININQDVEFLGFLNAKEIVSSYSRSFCLLHPTLIDNSPNSVCEAQVSGLPVIASKVGGVSSLIEHGRTGFLTTLNPKEIANTILSLYENYEKWQYISSESINIARKRHNPEDILQKTLNVYNKILKA